MIYYLGTISIIALAYVLRRLIDVITTPREPKGLHSEKAIIGNGWGIYEGEYVEGRYDI